jgi:hypothetical protein
MQQLHQSGEPVPARFAAQAEDLGAHGFPVTFGVGDIVGADRVSQRVAR